MHHNQQSPIEIISPYELGPGFFKTKMGWSIITRSYHDSAFIANVWYLNSIRKIIKYQSKKYYLQHFPSPFEGRQTFYMMSRKKSNKLNKKKVRFFTKRIDKKAKRKMREDIKGGLELEYLLHPDQNIREIAQHSLVKTSSKEGD